MKDRAPVQLSPPTRTAVLELWRDGRRPFTLRLEGGSMDPVARSGHRVTIQPVPDDQLRCGDIVAMHQGETVVVHRFLAARTAADGRRWYCQMGDNAPGWSWVLPETVLGRVADIERPDRNLHLAGRPWTRINPLAGRLGWCQVLLAGGGRLQGDRFRDAHLPGAGHPPPGRLLLRLRRGLTSPLVRLGLWLSSS